MEVQNIKERITALKQRINSWPDETTKFLDDKNEILTLTDDHFNKIEEEIKKLIELCKTLSGNDKDVISSYLNELKNFVEKKFIQAEQELTELKNQMNQGRHHLKAIKAYSKI